MEADHIRPELPHSLHCKVRRWAVEDCDATAVSSQRIRRNDALAGRPAGVDSIGKLCFFEDAQVHVGL